MFCQSIKKIIHLQNTEKDPPIIDPSKGWSPYLAKEFLKEHNIVTGYYSNYSEDEWSASSPPFKLDDNISPNDISYYVEGTEKIANSLELVLSVYDGIVNTNTNESLVIYSEILYQKVFNKPFPENFKIDILNGCNFVVDENLFEISLKREDWNNLNNGFDLSFKIKFNHYQD